MSTKEKQRMWDLAVIAPELARENHRANQGRTDKTNRGWMKNDKNVTSTGVKYWRPGTKALLKNLVYQKSTVSFDTNESFLPSSLIDWTGYKSKYLVAIPCNFCFAEQS